MGDDEDDSMLIDADPTFTLKRDLNPDTCIRDVTQLLVRAMSPFKLFILFIV